jgi:hypothetical protein
MKFITIQAGELDYFINVQNIVSVNALDHPTLYGTVIKLVNGDTITTGQDFIGVIESIKNA